MPIRCRGQIRGALERGSLGDRRWTAREIPHVVPAWWQKLWFKLLVLLCIGAGVALLVHARTRYLQARPYELEREILERTARLRTVMFGETPMLTTPSIGIATYPVCGQTQDALYEAADLALYEAKRSGRNTWRWYLPEMVM